MEEEREGEKQRRERETPTDCSRYTLRLGPNPQLRLVPWLGIEAQTFRFAGRCSSHLSHTAQGMDIKIFVSY